MNDIANYTRVGDKPTIAVTKDSCAAGGWRIVFVTMTDSQPTSALDIEAEMAFKIKDYYPKLARSHCRKFEGEMYGFGWRGGYEKVLLSRYCLSCRENHMDNTAQRAKICWLMTHTFNSKNRLNSIFLICLIYGHLISRHTSKFLTSTLISSVKLVQCSQRTMACLKLQTVLTSQHQSLQKIFGQYCTRTLTLSIVTQWLSGYAFQMEVQIL